MHKSSRGILALILGFVTLLLSGAAFADPPARAGRLGYISGTVSFSPSGESDWVFAMLNRPIIPGDRFWVDSGARAEAEVGAATLRMNSRTNMTVLNLDDNALQIQLIQGSLSLRVKSLGPNEILEIDTPNLAFSVKEPGNYRVDVDADEDATTVTTRRGRAEAFSEGVVYSVLARKSYRFYGTGLRDYESIEPLTRDDFDRWASMRNKLLDQSISANYVSPDVVGYQDLDSSGTWATDPEYGNVWTPNNVPADWAPYSTGHWAWIEPWGWTWVDDAPWGFAVTHYGRWVRRHERWSWVPGPRRERAVYAPALVAFVDGGDFTLEMSAGRVSGIGWFPLGPHEVYHPSYEASPRYLTRLNTSNTVISQTQITNITNIASATYVNQKARGAVTAVPASVFNHSEPVHQAIVPMRGGWGNAKVTSAPAIVPARASVMGAAAPAINTPPPVAISRPAITRTAPPAAPVSFANRENLLKANPGRPLDAAAMQRLHPAPAQAPQQNFEQRAPMMPQAGAPAMQPRGFEQRMQPAVPAANAPQAPSANNAPQGARPSAPPPRRRNMQQGSQPAAPAQQPVPRMQAPAPQPAPRQQQSFGNAPSNNAPRQNAPQAVKKPGGHKPEEKERQEERH